MKNIDHINEIFEINNKSKLKYNLSYIQLYILLRKINEYEPSIIKLIVFFIGIKNDILSIAKFYYNLNCDDYTLLIIRNIYPLKCDNIDFTIDKCNRYNLLYKNYLLYENQDDFYKKINYKNQENLLLTIGLLHIKYTDDECKFICYNYYEMCSKTRNKIDKIDKIYNISKLDTHFLELKNSFKKEHKSQIGHFELSKKKIEKIIKNPTIIDQYIGNEEFENDLLKLKTNIENCCCLYKEYLRKICKKIKKLKKNCLLL